MSDPGMKTRDGRGSALQSLVEWRASRIDDPVLKLKYLRSAVPRLEKSDHRVRGFLRFLPLALVLITVSACLVRAMVKVDPLPTHIRHINAPVLGAEGLPDVWQVETTNDGE